MRYYKNDMQVKKAYGWEDKLVVKNDEKITGKELEKKFEGICEYFGIDNAILATDKKHPFFKEIIWGPSYDTSYYVYAGRQKMHFIWLSPYGRKFSILLHEFAHLFISHHIELSKEYRGIIKKKDKNARISMHGPEWLTVYMLLLNRFAGIPLRELHDSAYQHNLKYLPELLKKYGTAA